MSALLLLACLVSLAAIVMYKWRDRKIPIIIISDIGTDPDDILAMMVACAVQKFDILAVITTGGDTINRGRVARRWLNIAGMDHETPVVPDLAPGSGNTKCFFPEDTQSEEESFLTVDKIGDDLAANIIVKLANEHKRELGIFAIGPLGPLAKACEKNPEIVQQIGFLAIQGQLKVHGNLIEPDFSSFNLREDEAGARVVFETLQHCVPFKLLGKHAAYAVPLSKDDIKHIPNFPSEVKTFLSILMDKNPDLFQRLYPVSEDKDQKCFLLG
eukprot:GFUD01034888.1.p1 GENE.GFUD01034888.1~~GFUD01034888.1.p1  ORF type:complete len:271 (-),score=63.60 GFUD01034888.1:216-1028(-)